MKYENIRSRLSLTFILLSCIIIICACPSSAAQAGIEWIKQTGGQQDSDDISAGVCGNGYIFVAGYATGFLQEQRDKSAHDALVTSYDAKGREVWSKRLGNSQDTYARAVYSDGESVYVVGNTDGAFPGHDNAGSIDAYIWKLDSSGKELWLKQFGSKANDYAYSIHAAGDSLYVAGVTYGELASQTGSGGSDLFITKFDSFGKEMWTRQFGSASNEYTFSVYADASGAYVAGITYGHIGQPSGGADALVRKYDPNGYILWTQQFGSVENDYANAVAADENGIYILGITFGSISGEPNLGRADAYLAKLTPAGEMQWTRQFGTDTSEFAWDISLYRGDVYVTGYTTGAFPGQSNSGAYDAYGAAFDRDGNLLWLKQFGTDKDDFAKGIYVGVEGIYIAGSTQGAYRGQQSKGASDIFLVKLSG